MRGCITHYLWELANSARDNRSRVNGALDVKASNLQKAKTGLIHLSKRGQKNGMMASEDAVMRVGIISFFS